MTEKQKTEESAEPLLWSPDQNSWLVMVQTRLEACKGEGGRNGSRQGGTFFSEGLVKNTP